MTYTPPIEDMKFGLRYLAVLDDLSGLPAFSEISTELADVVLEEAGKLAADVIAPLNHSSDHQGCARSEAGEVTTPDGFASAYKRWPKAGGQRLKLKKNMVASICPWR